MLSGIRTRHIILQHQHGPSGMHARCNIMAVWAREGEDVHAVQYTGSASKHTRAYCSLCTESAHVWRCGLHLPCMCTPGSPGGGISMLSW